MQLWLGGQCHKSWRKISMDHLLSKSPPITYISSTVLFLHDNTWSFLNIKFDQGRLYKAINYCQPLIHVQCLHPRGRRALISNDIQKNYSGHIYYQLHSIMHKEDMRKRRWSVKAQKIHRGSVKTSIIKDLLQLYKLSSLIW